MKLRFDKVREKDRKNILAFIRNKSRKLGKRYYYNPVFDEKTIVESLFREAMENLRLGTGFCVRNEHGLKALGIIVDLGFDSKILDRRIGRLILYISLTKEETRLFLRKIYLNAQEMGYDALFGRIDIEEIDINDVSEAVTSTDAQISTRFVLGDILLTLGLNLDREEPCQKMLQVERLNLVFANPTTSDVGKLKKITSFAFKHSHYFNDQNIKTSIADTLYQEWVENSLHGYADEVVVARSEKEIVGYISFRVKKLDDKAVSTIDLIAVEERYRGQGIGRALVIEGIKKIRGRTDTLLVGTQVSNLPALRLYCSLGFEPILCEVTFHLWNETTKRNMSLKKPEPEPSIR